jgi:hypothetical protein
LNHESLDSFLRRAFSREVEGATATARLSN